MYVVCVCMNVCMHAFPCLKLKCMLIRNFHNEVYVFFFVYFAGSSLTQLIGVHRAGGPYDSGIISLNNGLQEMSKRRYYNNAETSCALLPCIIQ